MATGGYKTLSPNQFIVHVDSLEGKFNSGLYNAKHMAGTEVLRDVERNFNNRSYQKSAWKARKKKYNHPILEETGKMRRSFHRSVDPLGVSVGSNVPYSKFHNSGERSTNYNLPQRQMLGHNLATEKLIQQIFYKLLDFTFNYKSKFFR